MHTYKNSENFLEPFCNMQMNNCKNDSRNLKSHVYVSIKANLKVRQVSIRHRSYYYSLVILLPLLWPVDCFNWTVLSSI